MDPYPEHARKCERLAAELAAVRARGVPVRLAKPTSNLFRDRRREPAPMLDVRGFNRLLRIDAERKVADVEGMLPYDALVAAALRCGLLPAVVPELKSITVGGAVSGIGIESSSFRYGLVHETVEEIEVMLGDGRIVVCSPRENRDLFFGFPNSYGTLGYALRLRVRLIPAAPYVHVVHTRFSEPGAFFTRISEVCAAKRADFLDGVVFSAREMYLTHGEFCEQAPAVSDYTWMRIYYRSIRERSEDWLTASGYIWRWDTDWFWCSKQFHAQHPMVRLLATRRFLNSRTWQRIMRLSHRLPLGGAMESVIQDVDIPVGRAAAFLEFLLREIGITPIWICPLQASDRGVQYPLYPLASDTVYINFGFWDVVPATHPPGYFSRRAEDRMVQLGGIKGLYSSVYLDRDTFWRLYGKPEYDALKARYDPQHVFPDLYAKCAVRTPFPPPAQAM